MLFLALVRLLFGYVRFTAIGGFPERFINLCRLNKIAVWELKNNGNMISACTDCQSYKRIRSVARKSGMKVRINRKNGLPFFLERHKNRMGIIAGAVFCVIVLVSLSTRIWSIDVIGNDSVPSEKIIGIFEELGVKKGASSSKIDIKSVELAALENLNELSWLNINISGSKALIEVRESVESPDIDEDTTPADIVAAKDGQIVIIRPFNGTVEEEVGNVVIKGDLLISGVKENGDLTVSFCRASGYVVARTTNNISFSQSDKLTVKKLAGRKKRYELNFLLFDIPLGIIDSENSYRRKKEVVINGVTLPLGVTEYTETVCVDSEITLSGEQNKTLGFLRFADKCTEELKYLDVEKYNVLYDENAGVTFSGEYICLENIGKEHIMQIEETDEQ